MPLFALAPSPPPPLPQPPAIVRTAEELGIDIKAHYEPPPPPPPPPLIGDKIVAVAETVLERYRAGNRTPSYGRITFYGAGIRGRCQQNVRNLVEASVYGKLRSWSEAGCCAGRTQLNLHKSSLKGKYIKITDIEELRPGDLVYLSGGRSCSSCRQRVGHTMVCMGRKKNGDLVMWQNTSLRGYLLCKIPLVSWQSSRFVAAYRFPMPKTKVEIVRTPQKLDSPPAIVERPRIIGHNLDLMTRSILAPVSGPMLIDPTRPIEQYVIQHDVFYGIMR